MLVDVEIHEVEAIVGVAVDCMNVCVDKSNLLGYMMVVAIVVVVGPL